MSGLMGLNMSDKYKSRPHPVDPSQDQSRGLAPQVTTGVRLNDGVRLDPDSDLVIDINPGHATEAQITRVLRALNQLHRAATGISLVYTVVGERRGKGVLQPETRYEPE
jgi:hypothetical protein